MQTIVSLGALLLLLAGLACGPSAPTSGAGGAGGGCGSMSPTPTQNGSPARTCDAGDGAGGGCSHSLPLDAPCSRDCDCCAGAACATLTRDGGMVQICAGACPEGDAGGE